MSYWTKHITGLINTRNGAGVMKARFIKSLLVVALLAGFTCGVCMMKADAAENPVVPRLLWKGKDVSPVCLAILEPNDGVDIDHLDLNDCAKDERFKNRRIMTDGGGITEYFTEKDDDSYEWKFSYSVNGDIGNGTVITLYQGRMQHVLVVKVDGDVLRKFKVIAIGSGCSAAIGKVEVVNRKIRVTKTRTPASLYALAYNKNLSADGQRPLLSADIDCFGSAVFEDNKLVQVNIDADSLRKDQVDNLSGIQGCFTKHYIEQSDIKKELSSFEFNAFMDRFVAECVGQQQDK